jgi:hypothetical protein
MQILVILCTVYRQLLLENCKQKCCCKFGVKLNETLHPHPPQRRSVRNSEAGLMPLMSKKSRARVQAT